MTQSNTKTSDINIFIQTMHLSGDREEHYVCIEREGREVTPYKFSGEHRNRAEYETAFLKYVLLGHPKPNLADPIYNDPIEEGSNETGK